MRRTLLHLGVICSVASVVPSVGHPQTQQSAGTIRSVISVTPTGDSGSLIPLKDPATVEQIREYLRLSGDMESFRARWIAAVGKNRSIGAPYWPEDFWTALTAEMQKADLLPMYVNLFQHGISTALMQEILDTYHSVGSDHFKGTPACFKFGDAELALTDDMDKLKLAKTTEVFTKVYDAFKPQIKAARAKYMAEHPGWQDK